MARRGSGAAAIARLSIQPVRSAAGTASRPFSQSLAQEVAGFGIKVTLIEPGGYSTDWGGSSAKHATELPAYDGVREQAANRLSRRGTPGDPVATRAAVLTLVDSDEPPLRVFFSETPLAIATADYESRLATWNQWQSLSVAAHTAARPEALRAKQRMAGQDRAAAGRAAYARLVIAAAVQAVPRRSRTKLELRRFRGRQARALVVGRR